MNCNRRIPMFYNYVVDYKNKDDQNLHRCFKIPTSCVRSAEDGARGLKEILERQGHIPFLIVEITGEYSFEELNAMADGKMKIPAEALIGNDIAFI